MSADRQHEKNVPIRYQETARMKEKTTLPEQLTNSLLTLKFTKMRSPSSSCR